MIDLEKQKKLLIGGGITVGVLAAGFGIAAAIHGASSSTTHMVNTPVKAQQTQQTYVPQAVPLHRGGDNSSQKIAKLQALDREDQAFLAGKGITIYRTTAPLGSACLSDGFTNADGYHGTSTAISYPASRNGQMGEICVAHSGKGGSRIITSPFVPR